MYNVKIIESSKELTKREVLKMKDTTNTLSIDELIKDGEETSFIITPVDYVILSIECDKFDSEEKTAKNIIVIDKEDKKYRSIDNTNYNLLKELNMCAHYSLSHYILPCIFYNHLYYLSIFQILDSYVLAYIS